MKRSLFFRTAIFLTFAVCFLNKAQAQKNKYHVYALKFGQRNNKIPVTDIAVGARSNDSVNVYFMYWLIKGDNGKNILVDAGFTDDAGINPKMVSFRQPDTMLEKLNMKSGDITDIIITHPHWDHIGGIDLYPNATVWMQKEDYNYFTGAAWQKDGKNGGFNKADVSKIVRRNLDGKLVLIDGDNKEIMPGIKVFTGSKHTFESQYVMVDQRIIIASDNSWFYYNLENLLSIPITHDMKAYTNNLKRMKSMIKNTDLIIPGHDPLVFKKFPAVAEDVVEIKY